MCAYAGSNMQRSEGSGGTGRADLSIYLSIYLSVCLSIYLSICLSIYLSNIDVLMYTCMHIYLEALGGAGVACVGMSQRLGVVVQHAYVKVCLCVHAYMDIHK